MSGADGGTRLTRPEKEIANKLALLDEEQQKRYDKHLSDCKLWRVKFYVVRCQPCAAFARRLNCGGTHGRSQTQGRTWTRQYLKVLK
jgi:hypothetical protein